MKMYFAIDTEIHFKIGALCHDLIDEFHPFKNKYPYVSNIGRRNLTNFRKSFEWGLCQEIDEILRCYPHSPNFFEPSIEQSLNSLYTIKTFLSYINYQSPLIEKTVQCWYESIEFLEKSDEIWNDTKLEFDKFIYDPAKIYHEWTENDNKKALYISLFENEYLPYTKKRIADLIGVYIFNLNLRVLEFQGKKNCNSYLITPISGNGSIKCSFSNQSDLLFLAFQKK